MRPRLVGMKRKPKDQSNPDAKRLKSNDSQTLRGPGSNSFFKYLQEGKLVNGTGPSVLTKSVSPLLSNTKLRPNFSGTLNQQVSKKTLSRSPTTSEKKPKKHNKEPILRTSQIHTNTTKSLSSVQPQTRDSKGTKSPLTRAASLPTRQQPLAMIAQTTSYKRSSLPILYSDLAEPKHPSLEIKDAATSCIQFGLGSNSLRLSYGNQLF